MNSPLRRCIWLCCRWRTCVVIFLYVLAVFLIENILINTVHRRTPLDDDYDVNTVVKQNIWSAEFHEVKEVPTVKSTPVSTTTVTRISPSAFRVNRSVFLSIFPSVLSSMKQQEDLFYRRRERTVNRYLHRIILEPIELCRPDTRMIILVHSHHPHTDRRAAIRSTWGEAVQTGSWPNERRNRSCAGLRLAFVLGLHRDPGLNDLVTEELFRHGDIVQGDFADSYQNMTLKSLFGLKVADQRCPGVRYLLKTDDDMIVNLPYLLHLLEHVHTNATRSIMGPLNIGSRVYRSGKWKLSKSEFPFDRYPPYESGSAYVITGDLVHQLFVTAEFVPHIHVDDVYVTGILGRILGVNHVRQRGFAYWTDKPPSACDLVMNQVVTGTKMTPTNLLALWKQLLMNPRCSVTVSTSYIPYSL